MRRFRSYKFHGAVDFAAKMPWAGFLIQGAQVASDLWGVGLQLGGVMGFVSDTMWGWIRRNEGNGTVFRPPPPSDLLGKAVRYLTGWSAHYTGGDWLSYEDHWLLLAADIVATDIVMANFTAQQFDQSTVEWLHKPGLYHEPWNPATIEALRSVGWKPQAEYSPPYEGLNFRSTNYEILKREAELFPNFLQSARRDFPRTTSASMFQYTAGELAQRLLTWGTGAQEIGTPVFEPEEYVFARMFEWGVLPPAPTSGEAIGRMVERALQIARANGEELPRLATMRAAAVEVWGSYDER